MNAIDKILINLNEKFYGEDIFLEDVIRQAFMSGLQIGIATNHDRRLNLAVLDYLNKNYLNNKD